MKGVLRKAMAKFWELLEESVLVQSTVTLVAIGVTSYLVLVGQDVPKEWWTVIGIIIGFWFGSKVQIEGKRAQRRLVEQTERAKKAFCD